MRLIFTGIAQQELLAALRYYENHRTGLGAELLEEIDSALSFMRRYPEGSAIKEKDVRQRPIRRFPFAIFYANRSDDIIVLLSPTLIATPRAGRTRSNLKR